MLFLNNISKLVEEWILSSGIKIIIGLVLLWIGWKLTTKITKVIVIIFEKRNLDKGISSFLEGLISILSKVLLIMIIMEYVGLKTSGLVALIGSTGLTIGLALQGSLSNFAGGVIILVIKPFIVGDVIEADGYIGVVDKIGIFYTYLTTFDNKQILIPNGELANKAITNYTNKDTRRVDLKFTVRYEEDINKVKAVLFSVINVEELILKEPEPFVRVSEPGKSSVVFIVRVWTKTEDYWNVYHNLSENVKIAFDKEKISIPYEQLDVHIK